MRGTPPQLFQTTLSTEHVAVLMNKHNFVDHV